MAKNKEKIVNTDVDTAHLVLGSDDKGYYGRRKIIINASVEDFNKDPFKVITDNLGNMLSLHNANVSEMEYLDNYMRGKQDILNKTRANNENKINNKHVTNYAWAFTKFKEGYYVGKPIKYVDLEEETAEDMKYFNRYLRNCGKASKDLIKYENMFVTGIAHTMTIPVKRDIDIENESPYSYEVLDNKDVFIVRANDILKTRLCAICISNVNNVNEYTVYYGDNFMVITEINNEYRLKLSGKMPVKDCITEYQLNEQRMGVFEVVLSALNSLNKIRSNQLDQTEEIVNAYLTFENVDVSSILEHSTEFREKRILAVNTTRPDTPAKIGSIVMPEPSMSVNNQYDKIEQRTYDIVGVPMATSNTGQGVSGEAQVYGGGWENAQTNALVDTTYIMLFEREDLVKFVEISKNAINTKIKDLVSSSIDIKYTINKSNNIMVKAQSLKYFIDAGFTREQALTYCEITDDPQHDGAVADENAEKLRELLKAEKVNNGLE